MPLNCSCSCFKNKLDTLMKTRHFPSIHPPSLQSSCALQSRILHLSKGARVCLSLCAFALCTRRFHHCIASAHKSIWTQEDKLGSLSQRDGSPTASTGYLAAPTAKRVHVQPFKQKRCALSHGYCAGTWHSSSAGSEYVSRVTQPSNAASPLVVANYGLSSP